MHDKDEDEVKRMPPTAARNRGGDWVTIGLEAYRIPPLGLLSIQDLGDDIKSLAGIKGVPTREQMQVVVRIVHTAMQRNYPEIRDTDVGEMLDMGNFSDILGSVLQIAGFKKAGPDAGETKPASSGATSTSG